MCFFAMGRFARVVAVDAPHHLTQRGNGWRFILVEFRGNFVDRPELEFWENRTTLRVKGEFALTAIDNDFLSGPSLLWT